MGCITINNPIIIVIKSHQENPLTVINSEIMIVYSYHPIMIIIELVTSHGPWHGGDHFFLGLFYPRPHSWMIIKPH
jgi:hypothetical protein